MSVNHIYSQVAGRSSVILHLITPLGCSTSAGGQIKIEIQLNGSNGMKFLTYQNIIFNLFIIITWNQVCEHQGILIGLHNMSLFIDLKKPAVQLFFDIMW